MAINLDPVSSIFPLRRFTLFCGICHLERHAAPTEVENNQSHHKNDELTCSMNHLENERDRSGFEISPDLQ